MLSKDGTSTPPRKQGVGNDHTFTEQGPRQAQGLEVEAPVVEAACSCLGDHPRPLPSAPPPDDGGVRMTGVNETRTSLTGQSWNHVPNLWNHISIRITTHSETSGQSIGRGQAPRKFDDR